MRIIFIAIILFFTTPIKSQDVVTIIGDCKLVELREVKAPHLSQAKNRNPNAKIWSDDETLPKSFFILKLKIKLKLLETRMN